MPSKVELMDFIVEPFAPEAVMSALMRLLLCMKAPNCSAIPATASVIVTASMVGSTSAGTLAVRSTVLVPMFLVPFLVMQRMVIVPLVAFGILEARSGIAHVLDVATPVAMSVYPLPPKL